MKKRETSYAAELITCEYFSGKQSGNLCKIPSTKHIFLYSKYIKKNLLQEAIRSIYAFTTAMVIIPKI